MPQFHLDLGDISAAKLFDGPDEFVKGYIEAMFFTSTGTLDDEDLSQASLAEMADEAMSRLFEECERFKRDNAEALETAIAEGDDVDMLQAGRDFWLTRNGHGAGYWDGDWPEPYATQLTDAAKLCGSTDLYRGDDGRLYLS